jgi:protein-S-isoprenylcysteine O-methyltransferase Ste14
VPVASVKDNPGVIAPPPLIAIALLALGYAAEWIWPTPPVPPLFRYGAGTLSVAAGAVLLASSLARFRAIGTNLQTHKPTIALATDGPYRRSRNPIYLGLISAYLGVAAAVGSLPMAALVVLFVLVLRFGVIAREEAYLAAKFGAAYDAYRAETPRWF